MKHIRKFNESSSRDEKMEWSEFFEILSFLYIDKIIKPGHPEFEDCLKDCLESLWREDSIQINSVRRFSDGEIFTLGDTITLDHGFGLDDNHKQVISKIWPSFDQMRADCGRSGIVLNREMWKVIK